MKIYRTKGFDQQVGERIDDAALCDAIDEVERGLAVTSLGGGLYKKRIAVPGRGKRGSYRVYFAYQPRSRVFFIAAHPKNRSGNIGVKEGISLKKLANKLLAYDPTEIRAAINVRVVREIRCPEKI